MNLLNFDELMRIDNYSAINSTFQKALELRLASIDEIPCLPDMNSRPIRNALIDEINNGSFLDRVKSFSLTNAAKKNINFIAELKECKKFILLNASSLCRDGSFTSCRMAKFWFEQEINQAIRNNSVYFYVAFDTFDIKIGTDLRKKILVLLPDEVDMIQNEYAKIREWNKKITVVNNVVTRLNYKIMQCGELKC